MISREDAARRVRSAYARIAEVDRPEIFITLRPQAEVAADADAVVDRVGAGEDLPLAGTLFAVKNNIDVAGVPTTAACPAFAYRPDEDAPVVGRLRAAGAVLLGVTNLDQFATGLVGTRSPYGAVRHATDPERISGGSSSGSGVAVGLGIVDFALGTDTAGSGRVPAAFQGIYGIKPSRGWSPRTGVVPACHSIDVVTVMDTDLARARLAASVLRGPDGLDPLAARPARDRAPLRRIGVAVPEQLGTLAPGWPEAYRTAVGEWSAAGYEVVEVEVAGLLDAARLLYDGAYVAERYTGVGEFIAAHPEDTDPTVRGIVLAAGEVAAWRLFADLDALEIHRARAEELWGRIDALLLPTTVMHPTLREVAADPVGVNSTLGRFTNFVNLLDMSALAYPAGEVSGLPFGVQLIGPAYADVPLADAVAAVVAAR